MSDYPLHVTRTEDGEYTAKLADFSDSPVGRGVDPYAAREDLLQPARDYLWLLKKKGALPAPSPVDDRPTISIEGATPEAREAMTHQFARMLDSQNKSTMICYSWTNHLVLNDS